MSDNNIPLFVQLMNTIHTKKQAPAWADVDDEERQYYKIKKTLEKYLYQDNYYDVLDIILNKIDLLQTVEVFERFNSIERIQKLVPVMVYLKKYLEEIYNNILALIDENIYEVLTKYIDQYKEKIEDIIDIDIEDPDEIVKKKYVVTDIFKKKKGILKKK